MQYITPVLVLISRFRLIYVAAPPGTRTQYTVSEKLFKTKIVQVLQFFGIRIFFSYFNHIETIRFSTLLD